MHCSVLVALTPTVSLWSNQCHAVAELVRYERLGTEMNHNQAMFTPRKLKIVCLPSIPLADLEQFDSRYALGRPYISLS